MDSEPYAAPAPPIAAPVVAAIDDDDAMAVVDDDDAIGADAFDRIPNLPLNPQAHQDPTGRPNNLAQAQLHARQFEYNHRLKRLYVCPICFRKFVKLQTHTRNMNNNARNLRNILERIHAECGHCSRVPAQTNAYRAIANGLHPGARVECLEVLTLVEQLLVARVHPQVIVYTSNSLTSYNMTYIPRAEYVVKNRLPINVRQLGQLFLFVEVQQHGNAHVRRLRRTNAIVNEQFRVRKQCVLDALLFLLRSNAFYAHVDIDWENLNDLFDNGTILQRLLRPHENNEAYTCTLEMNADADMEAKIWLQTHRHQMHWQTNDDEDDQQNQQRQYELAQGAFVRVDNVTNIQSVLSILRIRYPALIEHVASVPIQREHSIVQRDGFVSMAFPHLFPTGAGDFRQDRLIKVSLMKYFAYLMSHADARFCQDKRFVAYAFQCVMKNRIQEIAQLAIRRNSRLANAQWPMTVGELRELVQNNPAVLRSLIAYGKKIRTSKSFWIQANQEVSDMINQVGVPHLFITLTCADMHWPDLQRLFNQQCQPTSQQRIHNSAQDVPLLAADPNRQDYFLLMRFINERVESFVKTILVPVYNVNDWFYRFEFTHRNAPHMHGIFWIENAPTLPAELEQRNRQVEQELIRFFGRLSTAFMPPPPPPAQQQQNVHPSSRHFFADIVRNNDNDDNNMAEEDGDISSLVHSFQHHRCYESYCRRTTVRRDADERNRLQNEDFGLERCRFNFPKPLNTGPQIVNFLPPPDNQNDDDDDNQPPNMFTRFEPYRNHPHTVAYNRFMLQAWRAHMEVSVVLDVNQIARYLTKWTVAIEPGTAAIECIFEGALNFVVERNPQIAQAVQQFQENDPTLPLRAGSTGQLIETIIEQNCQLTRDYSLIEMMFFICSERLRECSRTFKV